MQGKTHLAVGVAATVFILRPGTVPEMLFGMAIASVGSVISDIDADYSMSRKYADRIIGYVTVICLLVLGLEFIYKLDIIQLLFLSKSIGRAIIGILVGALICSYGKTQNHRTFMHSFLVMAALSGCAWMIIPSMGMYFFLGFASHLILDLFNQKGMQLFFPLYPKYSLNLCRSDRKANAILFYCGTAGVVVEIILALARQHIA